MFVFIAANFVDVPF